MIKNFKTSKNSIAHEIFYRRKPKGFPLDLVKNSRQKLVLLHTANTLEDLSNTHGNKLKKLRGSRKDQYSIRINRKYRICFKWDDGAHDVEIVDYH